MKKPWESLHLPCFKTNIAIARGPGANLSLACRGSLIFLIITFASSISALNHNCSDFTNIPAGALSLMDTWSSRKGYHRFVGRTHVFSSFKVVVSPFRTWMWKLESLAFGGVTYWEEGLELLWITYRCISMFDFASKKKMSLTPLGFRCPLKPNRCCQRQLLWGNFLGHVPFRTFSSDSRRSRCSSDS